MYALVNPVSGGGRAEVMAKNAVLPAFDKAGVVVDARATRCAGDAYELARTLPFKDIDTGEPIDAFVVVGGDGTIHDVINGMLARGDGLVCWAPPSSSVNSIVGVNSVECSQSAHVVSCQTETSVANKANACFCFPHSVYCCLFFSQHKGVSAHLQCFPMRTRAVPCRYCRLAWSRPAQETP